MPQHTRSERAKRMKVSNSGGSSKGVDFSGKKTGVQTVEGKLKIPSK